MRYLLCTNEQISMDITFKSSAPGSLMLLGEYAVLHGQHALVSAIDKRMTVTLTPRNDNKILLDSALGQHETTLSQLKLISPFRFVLATVQAVRKYLSHGFHLKIESEFSDTVGFASSAAVTVATLSALITWCDLSVTEHDFIKLARRIVRHVQGTGSGADVAACVMGGIVLYRMKPFLAEKISCTHPITVVYSGSKTPTVDAIARVKQQFVNFPSLFNQIFKTINHCTLEGAAALGENDWRKLGAIFNIQQGLMNSLGVSTFNIDEIIKILRQQPTILGAKISGSGLGDCVVALGASAISDFSHLGAGVKNMSVKMSTEGVRCEKI